MKVLSDELQQAILIVLRAWTVATLRRDWPDLAEALDELNRVASGNAAR